MQIPDLRGHRNAFLVCEIDRSLDPADLCLTAGFEREVTSLIEPEQLRTPESLRVEVDGTRTIMPIPTACDRTVSRRNQVALELLRLPLVAPARVTERYSFSFAREQEFCQGVNRQPNASQFRPALSRWKALSCRRTTEDRRCWD
jgi:hypothetical protein